MLFLTQGLEMLQSAGLAWLAFQPRPSVPIAFALALGGGILLAFDNPARRSFISEMVPPEDIPNAVVLHSSLINLSRMFGPALAGLLVTTVGYGWCFTLDSISYAAVLYGLYLMRPSELSRGLRRPRRSGETREGIHYVLSHPKLWISFAMLAMIGTLAYNFSVTLPLFVTRTLHSSESVFTLLYSIFSLGAVICALLIAHRQMVRMRHIIYGALGMGVSMLALASVSNVPTAIPLAFLVGMASILFMTSTTAIVQVEARRDMHGRVLALQMVFVGGTSVIGGPLVGWLADAVNGRAPIYLGGAVCLLAGVFGILAARRHASHFHPGGIPTESELDSTLVVESK
jgi:MFS family permease